MVQFNDSVELILSVANSEMNMIDINRTLYPIIDIFFLDETFTKREHITEPHVCLNKFKILKITSLFHHNRIKPVMNSRELNESQSTYMLGNKRLNNIIEKNLREL